MKIIKHRLENEINIDNIRVFLSGSDNVLTMGFDETNFMKDDFSYFNKFSKELLYREYDSILIGGLGLGIIPFVLTKLTKLADVDVVENNSAVISAMNHMDYLQHVNIISENAIRYSTDKKYDMILMDLWWSINESTFISDRADIIKNYKNNLSENGVIYFPISDEII